MSERPDTDTVFHRVPAPGDVVALASHDYWGAKDGAKAVVDSVHYGWDLDDGMGRRVLIVFGASCYREPDRPTYVSCSGGPAPLVPMSKLLYVGTIVHTFWHWPNKVLPRAHSAVTYAETVHLWTWDGTTEADRG